MKQLQGGEDAASVLFNEYSIWVQVHGLPVGFMSERVCRRISGHIGKFLGSDPENFNGGWKAYMCIRVAIDARKLLEGSVPIKK